MVINLALCISGMSSRGVPVLQWWKYAISLALCISGMSSRGVLVLQWWKYNGLELGPLHQRYVLSSCSGLKVVEIYNTISWDLCISSIFSRVVLVLKRWKYIMAISLALCLSGMSSRGVLVLKRWKYAMAISGMSSRMEVKGKQCT